MKKEVIYTDPVFIEKATSSAVSGLLLRNIVDKETFGTRRQLSDIQQIFK